jgi:hypothetical protein
VGGADALNSLLTYSEVLVLRRQNAIVKHVYVPSNNMPCDELLSDISNHKPIRPTEDCRTHTQHQHGDLRLIISMNSATTLMTSHTEGCHTHPQHRFTRAV